MFYKSLLTWMSAGVSVQESGIVDGDFLLPTAPVPVGDFPRFGTGAAWGAKQI